MKTLINLGARVKTLHSLTKKNVVAGLGEIGMPLLRLISKTQPSLGYDINTKLVNKKKLREYQTIDTSFLHICIPFTEKFVTNVITLFNRFKPEILVIHSTVQPHTTFKIQSMLSRPVIYSPIRGVHRRMYYDLKRYRKFYAIEANVPRSKWAAIEFSKLMRKCGIRTKKMSNPLMLELAKIIVDTSYYGWLICYAQLSNMIANKYNVDYDEMWSFADEIHKFLGNRPKMFPGFIGGHCVLPNLDLINDGTLNLIKEINSDYAKILKRRYVKNKKR